MAVIPRAAIAAMALLVSCNAPRNAHAPEPANQQETIPAPALAALITKHGDIVRGLSEKGIFIKPEKPAPIHYVWVNDTFYNLPFEEKQSFLTDVCYYYLLEDPAICIIRIIDNQSGRDVGWFHRKSATMAMD